MSSSRLVGPVVLLCALAAAASASAQVSITTLGSASTENFDTLASAGTSSTVPTGWAFSEADTNANTTYTAGTGSSTTGDTYSFGASASTERALGQLRSGSLISTLGAQFQNNSGSTIDRLTIAYTGEQWRLGTTGRADQMDFQYSLDATSLTTGTWTNVDALDFASPVTTGATGALDGNAVANRTALSASIFGLSIGSGATFWIRWVDFDATSSDDGLGVDDFSLTAGACVCAAQGLDVRHDRDVQRVDRRLRHVGGGHHVPRRSQRVRRRRDVPGRGRRVPGRRLPAERHGLPRGRLGPLRSRRHVRRGRQLHPAREGERHGVPERGQPVRPPRDLRRVERRVPGGRRAAGRDAVRDRGSGPLRSRRHLRRVGRVRRPRDGRHRLLPHLDGPLRSGGALHGDGACVSGGRDLRGGDGLQRGERRALRRERHV